MYFNNFYNFFLVILIKIKSVQMHLIGRYAKNMRHMHVCYKLLIFLLQEIRILNEILNDEKKILKSN